MTETIALGSPDSPTAPWLKWLLSKAMKPRRSAFQQHGVNAPTMWPAISPLPSRRAGGRSWRLTVSPSARFCYRLDGNALRFAERADELADSSSRSIPKPSTTICTHAIPSPRTIFKGIYRLPPAHYLLFENGRLTVAPYWTPRFEDDRPVSFDSLRDEFRHLLRQATERQLDGGKAGCFLSGGTDSSTVAGMIGEVRGSPAATYSIGFEAQGYDEMAFARIAAKRFNTEHHEYYVTPADLVRSISAVATHYDQPFGNSSALPAYYCAKMAKEDGVDGVPEPARALNRRASCHGGRNEQQRRPSVALSAQSFRRFADLIASELGIKMTENKIPLLQGRLQRRLRVCWGCLRSTSTSGCHA